MSGSCHEISQSMHRTQRGTNTDLPLSRGGPSKEKTSRTPSLFKHSADKREVQVLFSMVSEEEKEKGVEQVCCLAPLIHYGNEEP